MVTQFGISRQVFNIVPNIKFHVNPSSGHHADMCGKTDKPTDREKDESTNSLTQLYQGKCIDGDLMSLSTINRV